MAEQFENVRARVIQRLTRRVYTSVRRYVDQAQPRLWGGTQGRGYLEMNLVTRTMTFVAFGKFVRTMTFVAFGNVWKTRSRKCWDYSLRSASHRQRMTVSSTALCALPRPLSACTVTKQLPE